LMKQYSINRSGSISELQRAVICGSMRNPSQRIEK